MPFDVLAFLVPAAWTVGVASAGYRIGYSHGHDQATIYALRTRMESTLTESDQ